MSDDEFRKRVVSVLDGLAKAVWRATIREGIYVDGLTTTISEIKDLIKETGAKEVWDENP